MSLINDALKQTRQMQQQGPRSNLPPLPPVESNQRKNLGWLVPGIIVLLLGAAVIFAGLSLSKPAPSAAGAMPATKSLTASAVSKPVAVPAVITNVTTNTTVITVAMPTPLELKLQGILFAPVRPCAIVSGQTVFVGDRINKFHVVAISRDSITLRSKTETRVLSLNLR